MATRGERLAELDRAKTQAKEAVRRLATLEDRLTQTERDITDAKFDESHSSALAAELQSRLQRDGVVGEDGKELPLEEAPAARKGGGDGDAKDH